ncbi:MAG: NAD(P)H-dependent oxidoreductase [Tissierellales bacterium]|nr:NAD(P)H-dependent oxidoreductase [Tissierellales bacterium]
MKVIALVGSLRRDSYNMKIAKFMKERYKDKLDIEILLPDLPIFNEDIENNPPIEVVNFKEKIKASEGVLIVSPEYNHSIPGGLKNALDWCSRVDRVLAKKPVFIVGASNGNVGTARSQMDLRTVLNSPGINAYVLPSNLVLIPNVNKLFNETDEFIDDRTIKYLDKVVDNFIDWSKKFS